MNTDIQTILDMIPDTSYGARLRGIEDAYGKLDVLPSEQQDLAKKILNSERMNSALGMGITGVSGALNAFNQFSDLSKSADVSSYYSALSDMRKGSGYNMYSNTDILNGYNSRPVQRKISAGSLNPTLGQSAAGIGSAMLSGASTGLQIGGPWGAVAGAVIGLAGGIGADSVGRMKNSLNADIINRSQNYESSRASLGLSSNADNARETQFGNLYGSRKAYGGFMKNYPFGSFGGFLSHSHGEGGTIVRIKTK